MSGADGGSGDKPTTAVKTCQRQALDARWHVMQRLFHACNRHWIGMITVFVLNYRMLRLELQQICKSYCHGGTNMCSLSVYQL